MATPLMCQRNPIPTPTLHHLGIRSRWQFADKLTFDTAFGLDA